MNFGNFLNSVGNSMCGVNVRQGIAHMIDTAKFALDDPNTAGQANAIDDPVPPSSTVLLSANPCAWDSMFSESSDCKVGAPGGTAYHLGTAAGAGGFVWNQAPGSADLDAAAAHFVAAGIATGCDGGTGISSCTSSTDSKLSGISSQALSNAMNFFIRNDDTARLDLGNSLAEQICYIFTGSYTVPCGYLTVTRGPISAFPGLTTSPTTVNLTWGMYTGGDDSGTAIDDASLGGNGVRDPFDSLLYFRFNSQFVSGIPSIQSPAEYCSSQSVPSVSASNNLYLCNPSFDSLSNQMEFAPCLTVSGDPVYGQTSNNSTGTCSGKLSAVGAGIEAENWFGKNAFTIPIISMLDQYGYLNNGWSRMINSANGGVPNYFTFLDAHNAAPTVAGTLRTGLAETTRSVSPFITSNFWDGMVSGNIFDSLAVTNPLSGDLVYWMALSVNQLTNSGLTYTPPAGTTQTFRFTLRSDMFFQDGRKVTSFDVAFSYLALKGTGAFAGGGAAPMTGVTILGPSQFDINVNAVGPFTLIELSALPIIPGAYWSNAGSNDWTSKISQCTATGATCYPAQYAVNSANPTTTLCTLNCTFPQTNMNVNTGQVGTSYDPITSHVLVGSGPFTCGTVTSAGSGSCSSSGTMNPPVGGSYVLSRFGKGLAPGSSISSIYFRSNGNLATYLWSGDTGDGTKDFLNFSVVAGCFGAAVTTAAPCAHFQRGIGAYGGPVPVGLAQIAIVNRFVGVNWVAPSTWVTTPPFGIVQLNPVLYENIITLNPASVAGCSTQYPTGGYDC